MNKKMITGGSMLAVLALTLGACSGTAKSQTVEEACGIVEDGIVSVSALGEDATTTDVMAEMNRIGDEITNTEVKKSWDSLVSTSKVIYKLADELEGVNPDDLTEEEFNEKSEAYATGMNNFEESFLGLVALCPALDDGSAEGGELDGDYVVEEEVIEEIPQS